MAAELSLVPRVQRGDETRSRRPLHSPLPIREENRHTNGGPRMNKSELIERLLEIVDDQREEIERALCGVGRLAIEAATSLNQDLEALLRQEERNLD